MENLFPALFLDRDGVVNREVGYLYKPQQVEFTAGIFDLCRVAQKLGYKLIVITNQAGIAREFYTEADLHSLMQWMTAEFEREQIHLDGYYYCPHHPEHGIGRYRQDCPDRKPQPGMLFRAARDHDIDLSQSLLVGDRCTDIEAGAAAGVGRLVLLEGTESGKCSSDLSYGRVRALAEVGDLLRKAEFYAGKP